MERDAAIISLQLKTSELEDLQSENERYKKSKLDQVSRDTLATNEALRKLVQKTQVDVDAEAAQHDDLKNDVNVLLEEIDVFDDQDLILKARERELRAQLRAAKCDISRLDEASAAAEEDIEFQRRDRTFYLAEKNRTSEAIDRRRATELASQTQRSAQLQQRMDMQQELFAEKLRLDSEMKRRPM